MKQPAYSALILTEATPKEIRGCVWAGQTTSDLLANTEDFRFPFKESSLACPFCGGVLSGDKGPTDGKKKPWEVNVLNLHHANPSPDCPANEFEIHPQGAIIEKIVTCHIMTQCAVAEGKGETLHSDASIPKLHAHWDGEEREFVIDLLETQKGLFKMGQNDEIPEVPIGQVQRAFPHIINPDKSGTWEDIIKTLPRWEDENPEDPNAPKISGWIVVDHRGEKKTLCGYILPGAQERGEVNNDELPKRYSVPIFSIVGPVQALSDDRTIVPAYLQANLECGHGTEPLEWREAVTVKTLKKEEKSLKKQKLQAEIARLPKDKIWEGFSTVLDHDINPDPEGQEPPQMLQGFRHGNDPKKWWLPGIGNPHAKIWVIGLYPSTEELKRKAGPKILAGASGKELFRLVREAGLDPNKDVFFENLVKRYMPGKSKLGAEIKLEQTWLLKKQLAHFKPERVIILGADVFKELAGNDKTFSAYRGTWLDAKYPRQVLQDDPSVKWTGRISGTFHPAGVLRPDGRHNLELFRHDFKELLLDKEKKNVEPTYKEIRTIEEMNAWYENERHALKTLHKAGLSCIYSLDTEGVSLEVEHDELLCLQISRVIGVLDPETKHFTPEEIPQEVDLLIFRENINPEFFAAALFEMESAQMDMFGDSEVETSPKKAAAPVFAVANSEEERKQIIAKHGTKKEARPLEIFTPYKRKQFLAKHEPEVGEIFNSLSVEKGCAGFVLTNANYDRIRLQRFLNWDLSLPGMRGGFDFPLDTMLAEHCLDESSDLGLKPCLNKHFNWPRQDTQLDAYAEAHKLTDIRSQIENEARRSEWSLYPWEVLRPYAAKDAYGTAALLAKQLKDIDAQVERYQGDRVDNNPNTLLKAFHIQCGAIDATYEMMTHGMPLGDKGIKILDELTSFYRSHESRMVSEYQDTVYRLTGLSKANPSSPEELSYVLFAENSPLRKQGIEPWKESGKNGRLWSEIPPEERGSCTPSTDAESLEIIASNCPDPEIQKFLLRLSETKTILTIRQNFLSDEGSGKGLDGRINRHTKCMHTSYTPTLDTNRCRSLPNLSTFPKMEGEMVKAILGEAPPYQIRQIVQAPPGTFLLNRDWTTAEVLGLGYLSQDRNMLEIISRLSDGMDFHCKLAVQTYASIRDSFAQIEASPNINKAWIEANFPEKQAKGITGIWEKAWSGEGWGEIAKQYGINDKVVGKSFDGNKPKFSEEAIHQIVKSVFKQMRSNIKPVTFGVPYGREALAIQKQLNREYYVNNVLDSDGKLITVSLEEAQAMIDSYKTGFPDAWGYLVSQADHAKERGFLRDHWGYIRHFPKGMKEGEMTRKAYNYQIQHIVAVLMNQAMQDWIRERHQRKLRSYAYTTLYDNIGWVVHEDELQDVWDISMRVMTSERPVGPLIGEIPELFNCHIPTDGELSYEWEGKLIDPTSLGINTHPELNLTGLEGKY